MLEYILFLTQQNAEKDYVGRIALAIPGYRLAISVCPSTFWLKFQVEAKLETLPEGNQLQVLWLLCH